MQNLYMRATITNVLFLECVSLLVKNITRYEWVLLSAKKIGYLRNVLTHIVHLYVKYVGKTHSLPHLPSESYPTQKICP